jgi:TM2 domain-containing membrane protein YozV
MKYITFLCFFLFSLNHLTAAAVAVPPELNSFIVKENATSIDIEEFLSLTPKKIKERTGKRLTLKQVFILKKAQKKLKKELRKPSRPNSGKSQVTALFLVIFLGVIGMHRFYLGYTALGFFYLMTFGGCFILAIFDLILIATGNLQPKNGTYSESLD